jgi:hypothetical protein
MLLGIIPSRDRLKVKRGKVFALARAGVNGIPTPSNKLNPTFPPFPFTFFPLRIFEPALQNGEAHDVYAVADAELTHRVGFVGFDGFDAERQAVGDFLVAVAPSDLRRTSIRVRLRLIQMLAPKRTDGSCRR